MTPFWIKGEFFGGDPTIGLCVVPRHKGHDHNLNILAMGVHVCKG